VHLYGRPAVIPDLGVVVIEDAAQAHGALDPGSGSDAAAYSFYPTKNLGGITDGGAVVTDDDDLAATLRLLRAHGVTTDYVHTRVSTNARLSDVAAAALRVGLRRLASDNARRRDIATRYHAAAPGLRWQPDHQRHVFHLCVARVPDRETFRNRVAFDTGVHYPLAMTQQPAYQEFVGAACPEAEQWAAECVSFPCFPELTDDEIEAVCRAIR
jgi:dTDP-4-amino-4,6-dideoxygalactose transaminase